MQDTNETYKGGPRTDAGKETASQNATKHGLCSNTVRILPHEKLEDYQALEATWFSAYRPSDSAETRLIKQLIDADWLLERANRTLAEIEEHIYNCGYLPINWSDDNHLKLARITRYQTSRANAVIKARKAVEDYRKNRTAEATKAEKHAIYKEKNKPDVKPVDAVYQTALKKCERERAACQNDPAKVAELDRKIAELKQKSGLS
jgi:hypothetical protein